MLAGLLLRQVQETLSIGRRGGRHVGGGGKIRQQVVPGWVLAADASPRESQALISDVGQTGWHRHSVVMTWGAFVWCLWLCCCSGW